MKFERKPVRKPRSFTMEKSMKTSVAMSETTSQSIVAAVLALRTQIPPTVSAEIETKIKNLRGILDSKTLTSARNGGDWRRGTAASSSYGNGLDSRWRSNNSRNSNMRNSASTGALSTDSTTSSTTGSPTPKANAVYTGPPVGRYQSRFKNNTEQIEEKILNRIILLKLNKFGPTTYSEIRDFLFQILGQESVKTDEGDSIQAGEGQVAEFVRDFMLMVFKKAAAEQIYCPLYAKLLAEIGAKHSVIFDEMNKLYDNYIEIFEEPDVNKAAGDMASFEKKNIEKKYRQGYSQFIAELTALEILPLNALGSIYKTLFTSMDKHSRIDDKKPLVEEYVDCLLRMCRVMKGKNTDFFRGARKHLYSQNRDTLENLINVRDSTYMSLSPKSRFLLMDILDILSTA